MRDYRERLVIGEIAFDDLTPGVLAAQFVAGKAAVLVRCPDVISELWRGLMEDDEEQLPWQAPLIDIARNYHGCADITVSLGDLFYFQPGQHGYIARKIALTRQGARGTLSVRPSFFVQGDGRFATRQQILELCWSVGDRLMTAMAPPGVTLNDYSVAVQRLKYQQLATDFDQLDSLARNSLGRWGRAGFSLDQRRLEAAGPLQRKGVSDFYGMIVQIPGIRSFARGVNRFFSRRDKRSPMLPGHKLIEAAHYDHRYFSALCGQRKNIETHIFVEGAWYNLPISMDTLAILPGSIAAAKFGVPHTLHRVVHIDCENEAPEHLPANGRAQNVTLLIGTA
jgi:hypothetical protein